MEDTRTSGHTRKMVEVAVSTPISHLYQTEPAHFSFSNRFPKFSLGTGSPSMEFISQPSL